MLTEIIGQRLDLLVIPMCCEKGDDSWNYIRLYANLREYVHMSPLGENMNEIVYLEGHLALSTSDLFDDPLPGSRHSKDVFTPHSTIPDIWKHVARTDDRITLVNREKVLPLPVEGRMREDSLVREAAVVGVDQLRRKSSMKVNLGCPWRSGCNSGQ